MKIYLIYARVALLTTINMNQRSFMCVESIYKECLLLALHLNQTSSEGFAPKDAFKPNLLRVIVILELVHIRFKCYNYPIGHVALK